MMMMIRCAGGKMLTGGNLSIWRISYAHATLFTTNLIPNELESKASRRGEKSATNRLRYGTARPDVQAHEICFKSYRAVNILHLHYKEKLSTFREIITACCGDHKKRAIIFRGRSDIFCMLQQVGGMCS
jgi:hypothetical protein